MVNKSDKKAIKAEIKKSIGLLISAKKLVKNIDDVLDPEQRWSLFLQMEQAIKEADDALHRSVQASIKTRFADRRSQI